MAGPLGETEFVVCPSRLGNFSDLYALSTLYCKRCSARWKQFRLAGSSLKSIRCPGCGRKAAQYYDGEPGPQSLHYLT